MMDIDDGYILWTGIWKGRPDSHRCKTGFAEQHYSIPQHLVILKVCSCTAFIPPLLTDTCHNFSSWHSKNDWIAAKSGTTHSSRAWWVPENSRYMDAIRGELALVVARCQTGIFRVSCWWCIRWLSGFQEGSNLSNVLLHGILIDWSYVQGSMGYSGRVDTSFWVRIDEWPPSSNW